MAKSVSDFLLERLSAWGVKRIFGFPGDGINAIMGALDAAGDRFELVRVSHEEMAAFMACAHAKYTGEVGVCLATSGPGAIHLLNGLYDAKMDHQPVVAIVGQQSRLALGGSYQQEVDLSLLFRDVRRLRPNGEPPGPGPPPCRSSGPTSSVGGACGDLHHLPNDVQEMDAVETPPRAPWHGALGNRLLAAPYRPGRSRPRTGCGRPQRGRAGGDAGRGRGAPGDRRGDRGGRHAAGRASPRPCSAKPPSRTTCPKLPARSVCWAPSRAGR